MSSFNNNNQQQQQQQLSPTQLPYYNIYQYQDHYTILGVSHDADTQTIKSAYRHLFFLYHPDRTGVHSRENLDFISRIQTAHEVLTNDASRRDYDIELNNNATRLNLINYTHMQGLETFSLDEFEFHEDFANNTVLWQKDCPRCKAAKSIVLSDWDLENSGKSDDTGGYLIVVQCSACSLCIKVRYYDLDD